MNPMLYPTEVNVMNREYLRLEKDDRNILLIFAELRKSLPPLQSMKRLMEVFPELKLVQAKEIMVLHDTDYKSLEDYQEDLFKQIMDELGEQADADK
ncbi:MAG: hypothetical protein HRU41_11170 [Saprospiraceae bacterium]|nr:hypothetical protein [Saprospiraceae bacterium]